MKVVYVLNEAMIRRLTLREPANDGTGRHNWRVETASRLPYEPREGVPYEGWNTLFQPDPEGIGSWMAEVLVTQASEPGSEGCPWVLNAVYEDPHLQVWVFDVEAVLPPAEESDTGRRAALLEDFYYHERGYGNIRRATVPR